VALVTGAGSGVGRATAQRLAAEGARVVVCDIDEASALETLASLPGGADEHRAAVADVADSAQVDAMFQMTDDEFGQLDILVSNAAVSRTPGDGRDEKDAAIVTRRRELAETGQSSTYADHVVHMGDDGWARMLAVNLSSAFYCSRAALRIMNRRNSGAIVCVSSIAAQSGTGPVHYAAAKAGVLGFVRSLALETAPRTIRVNAVCPGPVDSAMFRAVPADQRVGMETRIPIGRVGTPDDIAAAISYLSSDEAGYVTGAVVPVNGGLFIG
jgi:3-oxoacyl-[acyl-carrier protein] reductase